MKYAVLGLLIERRAYGYELANRLHERLGPGFRAAVGAVYVSLDQLSKEGLVVESKRVQVGRQVKVYYEATELGQRRFAQWMGQPPTREPLRGELYLKLAVARDDDLRALHEGLERLERNCQCELEEQARTLDVEADDGVSAAAAGAGIAIVGDEVRWPDAVRWLAHAAAVERLQADLRWLRLAIRAVACAADSGYVPRGELRRDDELANA
ncbi:MAG TPA: PadR family transcriptional regulator [Conexibacter sp.]|jgi:DNA-binding PadR family transcriptional regulator